MLWINHLCCTSSRDLWMDTLLRNRERKRRGKEPSTEWDLNPPPFDHEMCTLPLCYKRCSFVEWPCYVAGSVSNQWIRKISCFETNGAATLPENWFWNTRIGIEFVYRHCSFRFNIWSSFQFRFLNQTKRAKTFNFFSRRLETIFFWPQINFFRTPISIILIFYSKIIL